MRIWDIETNRVELDDDLQFVAVVYDDDTEYQFVLDVECDDGGVAVVADSPFAREITGHLELEYLTLDLMESRDAFFGELMAELY